MQVRNFNPPLESKFTFKKSGSTGDAMATPTVRTKAMKKIAQILARAISSTATMAGASPGLIDATTTKTVATAATRRTAKEAGVGMTSKLIAGTVRAPVAAATAPVKEKNLRIFADDVISSDVPVDSVSGCKDLYTCIQNLISVQNSYASNTSRIEKKINFKK